MRRDGLRDRPAPAPFTASRRSGATPLVPRHGGRMRVDAARERALRELTVLHEVARMLAAELDLPHLLQTVTDAATQLAGATFAAFVYEATDGAGQAYRLHAGSGAVPATFGLAGTPHALPLFAPTLVGAGVVRIDDVRADPRYAQVASGGAAVASVLAVPVRCGAGRVVGGLFLGHPRPAVFTDESERVVAGLAAQAAVAIEKARLYDRAREARAVAEEARRRAAFLAEASALLSSSLDPCATLRALAMLIVPRIADVCVVDVVEPDGSLHRAGAAQLEPSRSAAVRALLATTRLPADPRHPVRRVFEDGRTLLVREVADAPPASGAPDDGPPHAVTLRRLGLRSYLAAPLIARGRSLGVIGLGATQPGRYGDDDVVLVEDLARRAALAVDNARLFRAAQQANQAKDEFLTTVSHELRTPLAAIMNWVSTLRQGKLSPERAARALEVVHRAGEAQARLIEDILDASRTAAGRLRLELSTVHLAEVVSQAIEGVRPAAEAKGLCVEPLAPDPVGPIAGDAARLQQVMWNLLSNAVKFTPRGGRIAVSLRRAPREVTIVVADTGMGITADFLPFVFERFRQAERVDYRHAGLGLGLSIVKYLVEAHGGRVEARSAGCDRGAEFVVTLPLPSDQPAIGPVSAGADAG